MAAVNLVVDGYVNGKRLVYTALMNNATSPAITLKPTDSGCIVIVGQSTMAAVDGGTNSIILPAPSLGFNCEIIFNEAGDSTAGHNFQIQSNADNMYGNTAGVGAANAIDVTYIRRSGVAANALVGDYVRIWSDGQYYYYFAYSGGAATPWATA